MKHRALMLTLSLATSAGACALSQPPADEPLINPDDPDLPYRQGPTSDGIEEPTEATNRHRAGSVSRAELDAALDQGPGPMLAKIPVEAVVQEGKFAGWRLQTAPFPSIDLTTGDVVLGVNGRSLQHPLEVKVLWDDLRRTEAIRVDVVRGKERFELKFEVQGDPEALGARDMVKP